MAFQKPKDARPHDPAGFTPHSSGLASEHAREQGWQTNEDERRREAEGKRGLNGGTDYGARDFGDLPVDISSVQPAAAKPEKPEAQKRRKKAA